MNQAIFTPKDFDNFYSNSGLFPKHIVGSFRPGDILAIWFKGVRHYGIYVGDGLVIDNSKRDGGVAKVSIERFSAGRFIENYGHSGPLSRKEVINRAFDRIGQRWDLFSSNCETFFKECQGRSPISLQVIAGVFVAGIIAAGMTRR